jgi:hypothetical protein
LIDHTLGHDATRDATGASAARFRRGLLGVVRIWAIAFRPAKAMQARNLLAAGDFCLPENVRRSRQHALARSARAMVAEHASCAGLVAGGSAAGASLIRRFALPSTASIGAHAFRLGIRLVSSCLSVGSKEPLLLSLT